MYMMKQLPRTRNLITLLLVSFLFLAKGANAQTPSPPTVSGDSIYCSGDSIILTASSTDPTASFSWTGPSSFSASTATIKIPNATTSNRGAYSVTATVGTATSTATVVNVVVHARPSISAVTSNSPACTGVALTLGVTATSASGSPTYSWTGPGAFTSTSQNPSRSAATLAMGGEYYVTVTDSGCSTLDSTGVVVHTSPSFTSIGSNAPICSGSTLNLTVTAIASGAATYSWTGPASFTSAVQNPSITTTTAAMRGLYKVTVTDSGCTATDSIAVNIHATPVITSITGTTPVCTGTSSTISLNVNATTASGNPTYSWTGPAAFTSTLQNPSRSPVINGMGGEYIVTVTDSGCTAIDSTNVAVYVFPVISSVTHTNPTGCTTNDGSITLNGLLHSFPYSVTYTRNGVPVGPTTYTANAIGVLTIPGLSAGLYDSIKVTPGGTCTSANAGPVVISNPAPPASPTVSSTPVMACKGGTLYLYGTDASTGVTWTWSGPNSFSSTAQNPIINNVPLADTGVYYTYVTDASGCTSDVTTTFVHINPANSPVITSITGTTPVCTGATLSLSVSATNTPAASTTYSWTGPSGYTSTAQNPTRTPVTPPMAGTYTVTIQDSGCVVQDSTKVKVDISPVITSVVVTNPSTCHSSDGSLKLSGLLHSFAYDITYTKNGVAVGPVTYTANAIGVLTIPGLSAGLYDSIKATLDGTCVSPKVGPYTISNPSGPATPVVTSNSPICLNSTLNLSVRDTTSPAAPVTWTWTGPNSFSSASASPSISSTPFADSGVYYVYATDTNGCTSNTVAIDAQVKPLPANPTGTSNSPICAGSTLNLTSNSTTAGATFSWTGPAGFTSTTQNPSIANATTSMSGSYVVYAVLNGCNSASSKTLKVTVNEIPGVPTLASNIPCSGTGYKPNQHVLTLTTSDTTSGVTYKWTGPNSFSATSTATTQTRVNPPMTDTGWYYVYATLNGCSSAVDSIYVNITPTPAPPVPTPSLNQYCQYSTTKVLTATGDSLQWYTASAGGTALPGAPTPDGTTPALNIWYVTQTVSGCESNAAKDTALVKAKPLAPNISSSPYTYCQGDNAAALTAIGVNLLWYNSPTGGIGSPITPTPSTNAAGTFDYYVSQTVNGCESDRAHVSVTVKPKPAMPTVSPVTYCQGDIAVPLNAGGVNLLWYNVPVGGVGIVAAPTPITSYPDTAYYYVTQTVNGCASNRAELPVYTYYKPNAVIIAHQPYVCQHDTMSFSYYGNGTTDAAYNWTMPKGAAIIGGTGQGPVVARFDSAGRYNVLLQVDNHGCKSPLTSYAVDVRLSPIVPVVLQKEACQGDVVNLSIGTPNETIDSFKWDFGGASVIYGANGAGPYGIRFNTQGLYVVKLVAVRLACPSVTEMDTIYVHPQADAHIMSASNSSICSGDSVHFTAESYNPAYLYQWQPASYFENHTNQGDVYGFIDMSGYVKLSVTTEYGCTSTDSMLVKAEPCCDIYFPNAFTPNGDGLNDLFRPLSNGRQQIKDFRIANRWGQIMYESVDQHSGWNGKFGGVPQDMGSYFYYIEYKCSNGKTYTKKGEVVLVR